jgi:hypothetical protein
VEEAINFLRATVLEYLDVHHSIDVMHVEKNVCEGLLGTLLNMNEKTRDHEHARADLKKIEVRTELWLDDSLKGNMKIPFGYSTNV